jgi:zinc transport system substrate-binding protein
MKRVASIIFTIMAVLAVAALQPGCGKAEKAKSGKVSVVCTIFPQYDWVRRILGDRAESVDLAFIINNKIDLHSYQPSVEDVAKISSCDLFIYVGGESDEWVEEALAQAVNKNMIAVNLLKELGDKAKEEETLEGMEPEKHEEGAKEGEEGGPEYDEHVWLSLKNAQTLSPVIAEALAKADAANAETYRNNLVAYIEKLKALDEEYKSAIGAAPVKTLLFADRFPFRYLADDYGLKPYAAFSGCSAETEASFKTIAFLAKKVDELKLNNIMVTESSDKSIARAVKNATKARNQNILVLNALQSTTLEDVKNGATYLSMMESNLNVLREALK